MAKESAGSQNLRHFAAGESLFAEGDEARAVFVLQAGTARLERRVFRESLVVEEVGPGAVVGEVSFADGARHTVSCVAVSAVEAIVIEPGQFGSAVLTDPGLTGLVLRRLAARLAATHFRAGVLALRSIEARVMLQLRWETNEAGEGSPAPWVQVPWDLPDAIAAEAGAVRLALENLVRIGLIEIDGSGRFRIVDRGAYDRRLSWHELNDRFDAVESKG